MLKRVLNSTILWKTLVPIGGLLAILALLTISGVSALVNKIISSSVEQQRSMVFQFLDNDALERQKTLKQIFISGQRKSYEMAAIFAQNENVEKAYSLAHSGNINDPQSLEGVQARAMLKEYLKPFVESYQSVVGGSFSLHYHLPNGRSLARIWRDGWQVEVDGVRRDISDDISSFRATVMEVNRSRKPVMGIEVGRGGFVIRGLVPVTGAGGKHLGSVEMLSPFNEALSVFDQDGINYGIYMNSEQLEVARQLRGRPLLGRSFVRMGESDTTLFNKLVEESALQSAQKDGINIKYVDNYQIAIYPIIDFSGRAVGAITTIIDISANLADIATYIEESQHEQQRLLGLVAIVVMVTMLLIGLITYLNLNKGVVIPLQKAVDLARNLENGDLSYKLDEDREDEIGVLAKALNRVVDQLKCRADVAMAIASGDLRQEVKIASKNDVNGLALKKMIERLSASMSKVCESAMQVEDSSEQISSSSQSLASSASEQSASLQEIGSAVEETAEKIRENAESTQRADTNAREVLSLAKSGEVNMSNMEKAIADIETSGERVGSVIKIIEDIAFQTNLLALNAAVEAARAGVHGKGFAVVADEVRSLAGRSGKAAQESVGLIEQSRGFVKRGADILKDATAAFSDIVKKIDDLTALLSEIADSSEKQSVSIDHINNGFEQLSTATQSIAAVAEESAASAQELASQAKVLDSLLNEFHLS